MRRQAPQIGHKILALILKTCNKFFSLKSYCQFLKINLETLEKSSEIMN